MKRVALIGAAMLLQHMVCLQDVRAGEQFKPRGCEFSVEFPNKPRIFDIIIPGLGEVETAEYKTGSTPKDSFFLVAEGFPVPKDAPMHQQPKEFLLKGAQDYARSNGIQNAEFRYFEDKLGKGISMRGFKTIRGVSVIYSTLNVLGNSSMISLRAGAAAESYPPPGLVKFLGSIKK